MKMNTIKLSPATIARIGEHSPTGKMVPTNKPDEIEVDDEVLAELKRLAALENCSIEEVIRKRIY